MFGAHQQLTAPAATAATMQHEQGSSFNTAAVIELGTAASAGINSSSSSNSSC
jgi:hypothetical protein